MAAPQLGERRRGDEAIGLIARDPQRRAVAPLQEGRLRWISRTSSCGVSAGMTRLRRAAPRPRKTRSVRPSWRCAQATRTGAMVRGSPGGWIWPSVSRARRGGAARSLRRVPRSPALLPRTIAPVRVAWAHRHDGRTDLVFLGRGAARLSRVIPAETPQELVREIQRSLALLQWRDCAALWISGDETDRFISAPALSELGAAISEPPFGGAGPVPRRLAARRAARGRHARLGRCHRLAAAADQSPARAPAAIARLSRQLVTGMMLCLTVLMGLDLGAQVWQR